jgi:hypothetical protein
MPDYPVETDFLLYACRLDPDLDLDQKLQNLPESFDWEKLVQTSFDHGVTALLCHNLLLAGPELVPDEIHHAAAEFLKIQQKNNSAQADQLGGILDELNNTGIQAIPFKGMTLAMSAYGKLNLRSSRDIDILIHEQDIPACLQKLRELGFSHDWNLSPRQWQEFVNYAGEDILFGPGVPVEPHWAFVPRTLAIEIDYAAIWARSKTVLFNDRSILSLSAEDEFIVLCLHGCKEEWAKLKWVVDVAEFIRSHPSLCWRELITYADGQHIARIVKIGILLAVNLINIKMPDEVNRWINNDRMAVKLAANLTDEFFSKDKSTLDIWKPGRFHWSMRERLVDRLRYYMRTIAQPRVQYFEEVNIPDRLFLLYWPYRLIHDLIAIPVWKLIKIIYPSKSKNETG